MILQRHRKLLDFSSRPFRSHPAKTKVAGQHGMSNHNPPQVGPRDQMKLIFEASKASTVPDIEVVSKCPGFPCENERFHRPCKGWKHRQRIGDLRRLCFGTSQSGDTVLASKFDQEEMDVEMDRDNPTWINH